MDIFTLKVTYEPESIEPEELFSINFKDGNEADEYRTELIDRWLHNHKKARHIVEDENLFLCVLGAKVDQFNIGNYRLSGGELININDDGSLCDKIDTSTDDEIIECIDEDGGYALREVETEEETEEVPEEDEEYDAPKKVKKEHLYNVDVKYLITIEVNRVNNLDNIPFDVSDYAIAGNYISYNKIEIDPQYEDDDM